MKYFTNLMYNISIFKILYIITFTNILATNNNEYIVNENPINEKYKGLTILKQVKDIERPLTSIFSFIRTLDGICVKLSKELYSRIDYLNFGECETVISFESSYNGIEVLPEYFKSFKSIENLNLCGNGLETSCLDIITQLITLKTLNIANNSIKEISANISKLKNLKYLYLGGGWLTYVADELYDLNLITLEWSWLACAYWESGEDKNSDIFKLINDSLKIKTLENFMASDVDLFDFNFDKKGEEEEYHLKRLTLENCNLSELSDSILELKVLDYLNLKNNRFTKVPSILLEFISLKELDLTGNYIISYKNISFHSLETFHMEWNESSNGEVSINNTSFTHLKYLHIKISTYKSNNLRFKSSTIRNLVGLYQYGIYKIETKEYKHILKKLEFLHIEQICGSDNINFISYLTNLRELDFTVKTYSSGEFLETLFSNMKRLKNLEYLSLKTHYNNTLLDDKICDLKNLKELHLYKFHIKNIECFNKISELKSISFVYTRFREAKDQINLFLKQNKIKVTYMNCEFNSILGLEGVNEDKNHKDVECWWDC